jgi:hypothetical protein
VLHVIVFSRARPLQLHGYLTSLYQQCQGDFRVSVLAKIDDIYGDAYQEVIAEFPDGQFWHETGFDHDLHGIFDLGKDAEFTMFGCDDVVFVEPFDVGKVAEVLDKIPGVLGLSLRLGGNITRNMFGEPLPQPEDPSCWDAGSPQSVGDWAYPWEVLGTVYRTGFATSMMAMLAAGSPSQLEERGSRRWTECTDLHHLAAYPTSRLVVPTVNVVQHEFPNGITSPRELGPEFLLDCWNHGLRLDTDRYAGMTPPSWRVGEFYLRAV